MIFTILSHPLIAPLMTVYISVLMLIKSRLRKNAEWRVLSLTQKTSAFMQSTIVPIMHYTSDAIIGLITYLVSIYSIKIFITCLSCTKILLTVCQSLSVPCIAVQAIYLFIPKRRYKKK
jgi:hypothetical protein